ncbi:MAG: hypothetical protein RLY31_1302 [Bacteroidota bacterium]
MGLKNNKHEQNIFELVTRYDDMLEEGRVYFADLDAYNHLVAFYEREFLLDKAVEACDHALRQQVDSLDFQLRKAMLLLEKKEADKALAVLDQLQSLVPFHLEASLLRAECYAAIGLHEEGLALLDELKEVASPQLLSDIYVCEALIRDDMKDHEQAFFLLKAALEENPGNTEALSRMWFCVENARKHKESVVLHERIIDKDPYNPLAWYNLGAAHHYLCQYEKAIEAYEYAFLIKEDFEFAYRDCAEVCLYVRDFGKALQCYQEVLEHFDPDADLLMHIGICHRELGNYIMAKSFFQQAIDMDSFSAEAHFQLGECQAAQGDYHKAIRSYQKAVRMDDRNEAYYGQLAVAYDRVGNHRKAESCYRLAADTGPENPVYWMQLVRFLMASGRKEDALEVLEEAEDYAYSPELLYCRSACLYELGLRKDALLALEEALYENYEAHNELFRFNPVLENDTEIRAVIAVFQPEREV